MKEKLKGLVIGMIIGALLVPTVFATVGTVTKELSYNNIKITMDGTEVKPTDASGKYVEPFIIDGTTYLPVRGIANALGLGVEWDGATNTVKLSSDKMSSGGSGATGTKLQVGEVIFNEAGIKVTLTEIEKDSYHMYDTYYFLVENNTDYIAYFSGKDFVVDEHIYADAPYYVIVPRLDARVQPHKSKIYKVDLNKLYDGKIEYIEFSAEYKVVDEEWEIIGITNTISEGKKTIILTK